MIIEDGTGKGNKAKVNSENRLLVNSVNSTEFSKISREGSAYQLHFKRVLTSATTFEVMAHLTYTGDDILIIDSVSCGKEDVALTSNNGQALFEFSFKTEYTSGGSLQTAFPVNAASNNSLSIDAYNASSTMTIDESGRQKILDLICSDTSVYYDFKDAMILKKGDTMSIKVKSKNIGDTGHIALFVYETSGE